MTEQKEPTAYEKELAKAAEELGLPETDWRVEKLATLQLMFKVSRSKWASGQATNDANQMLALMTEISAIRDAAGLSAPREIKVSFIRKVKCPHCQKLSEESDEPFTGPGADRQTHVDPAVEAAARAAATPPPPADEKPLSDVPKPAAPALKVTRPGLSPSAFHDQQLPSGEVPPLRRLQAPHYPIRSVSPMSNGKG
jgi:hypothetical protein